MIDLTALERGPLAEAEMVRIRTIGRAVRAANAHEQSRVNASLLDLFDRLARVSLCPPKELTP